ncbi:MAG6450 family protein [Lactococcus lactis]
MAKLTNNYNDVDQVPQKLTNTGVNSDIRLKKLVSSWNEKSFKFALTGSLDNEFCFKKLKPNHIKEFHKFIDEILSKRLTISQVDKLFLRTKGKVIEKEQIFGKERDILHYGKNNSSFRIHGYLNDDGYFVICKIDPNHKVHKC